MMIGFVVTHKYKIKDAYFSLSLSFFLGGTSTIAVFLVNRALIGTLWDTYIESALEYPNIRITLWVKDITGGSI
ncbi:MAG: hypothetical protein RL248_1691 [Pseudomonadota bacterium]